MSNPASATSARATANQAYDYAQLDVSDAKAIEDFKPSFDRLDVLVLAQGTVIYRRGEFEMAGFAKVIDVNLNSMMACAMKFREALAASGGALITAVQELLGGLRRWPRTPSGQPSDS